MNFIDLPARRKLLEAEAAQAGKTFVVKTFTGADVGLEVEKGDFVATICTDRPDEDNEVVQPRLIDLKRFQKVMSVHLDHDIQSLPIGRAKWIKTGDHDLISKYFVSQATPETCAIDFMLKEGVLHQHSISFIGDKAVAPTASDLAANNHWKGKRVYKGNPLMIEFSVVGQPANSDCDMIAIGKRFGAGVVDWITGKTAATSAAVEKIIAEVPPPATEAELRLAVGKRLEIITKNIDRDAVIRRAMMGIGTAK